MKRLITYFLTIAMLVSIISIAPVGVYAKNTLVAQFDSEDDLENWWYRYSGWVNVATGKHMNGSSYGSAEPNYHFVDSIASGDEVIYPTMGSKFFGVSDIRHGGSQDATSTLRLKDPKGTPVNGAAYLNIKLYSEIGGTNVLRWSIESISSSTGSQSLYYANNGSKLTLKGGWETISLPIPKGYESDLITGFSYMTGGGYGLDSNGKEEYKNTTLWIDGVYLSETLPWTPEIIGSSIKDGNQLVSNDIGRITLKGKDIDIPQDGAITMEPHVDMNFEKDGDNLDILFGDLEYATSYTLSFDSGVYDIFGNEFKPYTLSFRVRGEDENIPPTVALTSPEDGGRYLPTDSIVLTAEATDENGTVEYVEFYLDDELIEGSRVTSDTEEFTYTWTNAPESTDIRRITAVAVDNAGSEVVSDPIKIKVLGYKNPTVSIVSPADNAVFYGSVGGAEGTRGFTLEAKTDDIDSSVAKIDVYLDGNLIHTATDKLAEFKYSYNEVLSDGKHEIEVVATDDMDLTGSASVSVDVLSVGKSFPAVLANDLSLGKWSVTAETAKVTTSEDGIVVTTEESDAVRLVRTLKRNMTIYPWQADIAVTPKDTSHTITLGITGKNDISLVTFKSNGKTSLGTTYEAGKTYVVSAVADIVNKKLTTFINGEPVGKDPVSISADDIKSFESQVQLFVSHNGAKAATVVNSAEVYLLREACKFDKIEIYDDGIVCSTDAVSRTADYITVELDGGTDVSTLDGNVKLVDKLSGREAATELRDGRIYINEILRSGKVYSVVIGSGVSNNEGRGLAGRYIADFRVEEAPIDIKMSGDGDSIVVTSKNTSGQSKDAVVVVCVYDGNRMVQPAVITPIVIAEGTVTHPPVSIPGAQAGNDIEAFVVDSMDTLNTISDDIYIIKKEG